VNDEHPSFAARVIRLYLDDPDTPDLPSSADWDIAQSLEKWGISFDTIQLAFRLAFIRRKRSTSDTNLPPIRSLAYFRAVALNLTPHERDPAYFDYVRQLYEQIRDSELDASAQTSAQNRAPQPESRGLS
jgi:hypothetical protein